MHTLWKAGLDVTHLHLYSSQGVMLMSMQPYRAGAVPLE